MIAPEAILPYDDSNCDTQEDYNEFVNDDGTVWMTDNMIEVIKEEVSYSNYEVENESETRIAKTDLTDNETEVAAENQEFDSRPLYDEITEEVCDKSEESLILGGTVDIDLEITKTETQILYEKNFNQSEELYNVDEYEREIHRVGDEILEYQESAKLSEEQVLEDVEVQEVQVRF